MPALNAKIHDLEQLASQPNFWDDRARAEKLLQQLNDLKSSRDRYLHWQTSWEDAGAIAELLELDNDEGLLLEATQTITELNQALDRWELQQLLSGEYDTEGAILTINAGAGGTDAQDWAEMLMRMYMRWGEKQGYKVIEKGCSRGDPADV